MILVDFSGVVWSGLHGAAYSMGKNLDEDYFRHMILNMLRSYNVKFRGTYGKMTICMDGKNYWRKDIHPHYKASRKKARDKNKLDMDEIFKWVDRIKEDLRDNFPYKIVEVEGAEADDVIALLTRRYCMSEKVLILSEDHDMGQLQRYKNVEQWAPKRKKMIVKDNPTAYLKEHLITGDSGDGVPNVFSDLDTFVTEGKRQTPVKKKDLARWVKMSAEDFCRETGVSTLRYSLNEQLVDLTKTPEVLMKAIVKTYDEFTPAPRSKIMEYFIKHRMKLLLDCIGEF